VIGATELITGGVSSASTPDGLENVGDVITYPLHTEVRNPNTRVRKLTYGIIGATALGVSMKAGIDLGLGHESIPDPTTICATAASLAWKGLHFVRLRRELRHTGHHADTGKRDLFKHVAVDSLVATAALTGEALQRIIPGAAELAEITGGLISMYHFRPTRANLAHDHSNDHTVHTEAHTEHHHRHTKEHRRPSRLRLAMGLGTTALALVGGVLSGDTVHVDGHVAAQAPASAATSRPNTGQSHQLEPHHVTPAPTKHVAAWHCATVKPGESEWGMIAQQISVTTDRQVPVAAINAITMLTALENAWTFPDPNHIAVNKCLEIPTPAATQVLYDAIEHSENADHELVADLRMLDNQPDIDVVMSMQAIQEQIDANLLHVLAQPA